MFRAAGGWLMKLICLFLTQEYTFLKFIQTAILNIFGKEITAIAEIWANDMKVIVIGNMCFKTKLLVLCYLLPCLLHLF